MDAIRGEVNGFAHDFNRTCLPRYVVNQEINGSQQVHLQGSSVAPGIFRRCTQVSSPRFALYKCVACSKKRNGRLLFAGCSKFTSSVTLLDGKPKETFVETGDPFWTPSSTGFKPGQQAKHLSCGCLLLGPSMRARHMGHAWFMSLKSRVMFTSDTLHLPRSPRLEGALPAPGSADRHCHVVNSIRIQTRKDRAI